MAKKKSQVSSQEYNSNYPNPVRNYSPEVVQQDNRYNTTFGEVYYHYVYGEQDMNARKLRKNGWDEVIKAFYGKLPNNWPYLSRVTDPVIRTALIEKTSRLFNGKLRGTVVPREGGDQVKAKIINAVLDYQWDNAQIGGSMIEKWALMDTQTRLFGASFALCYWTKDRNYEGPEFKVLDNRDVFVDYQATHVKNANWVQVREWKTLQDLKDAVVDGQNIYENLDELEKKIFEEASGDRRDVRYTSMSKQLKGLTDRVGMDIYFKTFEIVTEYRHDRWITIAPRYGIVLRDIDTPLICKEIPIVQLRYYNTGDDVYGDSEVEPVLPLQRSINAMLCGFLDQINFSLKPPIKVANNADGVRLDTIVYAPNALWLTGSSPNNILEHQSGTQVVQQFSSTYQILKSAFNTAMGEASAGVSNLSPSSTEKTATEIKATYKQMLSRDEYNQMYLEESLKDQMVLWILLTQQFLFDDPSKYTILFRITGMDMLNELKQYEMDQEEIPSGVTQQLASVIEQDPNALDPDMIQAIAHNTAVPRFPVNTNPGGKIPSFIPKLEMDKYGDYAVLAVNKDDLQGTYDYIPDVKSMSIGMTEQAIAGRNQALQILLNPNVNMQLQQEGDKIKMKELIVAILEDNGLRNANKYFEPVQQPQQPAQQLGGGIPNNLPTGGTPNPSPVNTGINPAQGFPTSPELFGGANAAVSQPSGL